MKSAYWTLCKHCLEPEGQHASYGKWCPRRSEYGHFTFWDKEHTFEGIDLVKENKRLQELYDIANEHRISMSDEIQALTRINEIEVEANKKLRKSHHELVKDNRQLKSLLKKVFEALPSKSEIGTELYEKIEEAVS